MWTFPEFITSKSHKYGNLVLFVTCCKYHFSPLWYDLVRDCMVINNEKVHLKTALIWHTEVSFIGGKKIQFSDTLNSTDGSELVKVTMVCGLVDLNKRRSVRLPPEIEDEAKWIEHPLDLLNIETKTQPAHQPLSRKDIIKKQNIDFNKHTNYGFYIEVACKAFKMSDQGISRLEQFEILLRKETVLNDTLETEVWKTNMVGEYCCKISCKDQDVVFCRAKFKEHSKV